MHTTLEYLQKTATLLNFHFKIKYCQVIAPNTFYRLHNVYDQRYYALKSVQRILVHAAKHALWRVLLA